MTFTSDKRMNVFLIGIICLVTSRLSAETVQGWRTNGTGVYADASPPVEWSADKNVIWKTNMPGRSNSQPIRVGDRLFVGADPSTLVCVDVATGRILWQQTNAYEEVANVEEWRAAQQQFPIARRLQAELKTAEDRQKRLRQQFDDAEEAQQEQIDKDLEAVGESIEALETQLEQLTLANKFTLPGTHEKYNGYTTATPTSDGRHVWVVFGNRVVACFDLEGERQWATVLPDNPQLQWGHSASPLLVGDRLIVNIEDIVALEASTGREIWRTRNGMSWGSSLLTRIGDEDVVLMSNGRWVRASDGTVLTRVPGLSRNSPILNNGVAYYVDVRALAFPLPTKLAEGTKLKPAWTASPKGGGFTGSPVCHEGLIYAVSTKGILNVLEEETGNPVYQKRLNLGRDEHWPSLCIAGKYVYISNIGGSTLVIETGREFRQVAVNQLEPFISTPVFFENRMYIRTFDHLYCIGAQ